MNVNERVVGRQTNGAIIRKCGENGISDHEGIFGVIRTSARMNDRWVGMGVVGIWCHQEKDHEPKKIRVMY